VSERTDWAALLRAGLGQLGLRPAEFWSLTPAELMLMLGRDGAARPMGRAALMALSANWPDAENGHG